MFMRPELQDIRDRARVSASRSPNVSWADRYRALAEAANILDAFMARSEAGVSIDNSSLASPDSIPEYLRRPADSDSTLDDTTTVATSDEVENLRPPPDSPADNPSGNVLPVTSAPSLRYLIAANIAEFRNERDLAAHSFPSGFRTFAEYDFAIQVLEELLEFTETQESSPP